MTLERKAHPGQAGVGLFIEVWITSSYTASVTGGPPAQTLRCLLSLRWWLER